MVDYKYVPREIVHARLYLGVHSLQCTIEWEEGISFKSIRNGVPRRAAATLFVNTRRIPHNEDTLKQLPLFKTLGET